MSYNAQSRNDEMREGKWTLAILVHGEGKDPKGQAMAAINIRCLEGIDLSAIPVRNFDGRSL